jgi:hypothetical protein
MTDKRLQEYYNNNKHMAKDQNKSDHGSRNTRRNPTLPPSTTIVPNVVVDGVVVPDIDPGVLA